MGMGALTKTLFGDDENCECECDQGYYGVSCRHMEYKCSREVHCHGHGDPRKNSSRQGSCECICDSGYQGDTCYSREDFFSFWTIFWISSIVFLSLLILTSLCCLCDRHPKKKVRISKQQLQRYRISKPSQKYSTTHSNRNERSRHQPRPYPVSQPAQYPIQENQFQTNHPENKHARVYAVFV